jgi:transcriptional regulator with XRE-family HTH domain
LFCGGIITTTSTNVYKHLLIVKRFYKHLLIFSMYSTFLRQKIEESGKTQKEVAAHAGITTAALANYLNGSRSPQLDVAKKLCDACGYDLIFLKKGSISVDEATIVDSNKKSTNVDIDINGAIELSNTPASRLAQLVGVSPATFTAWQNGTATPTVEELSRLFNQVVALALSSRHAATSQATAEPETPPAQATA